MWPCQLTFFPPPRMGILDLHRIRFLGTGRQATLSSKHPQELFALQTQRAQAAMEEAQLYWRHVYNIMVGAQAELTANVEAQFKQRQHDAQVFVDTVASNAPAGSEAAVNALQTAVGDD